LIEKFSCHAYLCLAANVVERLVFDLAQCYHIILTFLRTCNKTAGALMFLGIQRGAGQKKRRRAEQSGGTRDMLMASSRRGPAPVTLSREGSSS